MSRRSRRFRGLFAQLIDSLQIALAHRVNKSLIRQIRHTDQAEVPVLAVQQTPGHGLIEKLEPVNPDNRRLVQRLFEEVGVRRAALLFLGQLRHAAPERAAIGRAKVELGDQYRFVQSAQLGKVVTVLRLEGVHVKAQYIAILRARRHCFWSTDGETTAEQQLIRRMPFQRVGDGLEISVSEDFLEIFEIGFDFRMLRVRHGRHETRIFHQLPRRQIDTPCLRQPRLIAVLVAQLLEERAFGRYVGGHFQRAVSQRVTRLRIVAGTGPRQLVIGEIADQPWIVAMIAGRDGHGTLGRHGETRVERIGHRAPPVVAGADAGVIADDRQRQGVRHALGIDHGVCTPVAEGVETPGLKTIKGMTGPLLFIDRGSTRRGSGRLRRWRNRFRFGRLSDASLGLLRGGNRFCGIDGGFLSRASLGRFGHPGLDVAVGFARFAIQALQVGAIEVIPAPVAIASALIGAVAATVIAFAEMAGERFTGFWQGFEHPLAPGHVGLIDLGADGVDAEGVERMPFRRHQVPAAVTFFGAEKTTGLERRTFAPAPELVQ